MSEWLKPKEYLPKAAELDIGEQVHVNHLGCTEGTDRKKRLYIKRNDDGSYIAYCQHCKRKGYSKSSEYKVRSLRSELSASPERKEKAAGETDAYDDASPAWSDWPTKYVTWLKSYGISQAVSKKYDLNVTNYDEVDDPTSQRLLFPIKLGTNQGTGTFFVDNLIYEQLRSLELDPKIPKYINADYRGPEDRQVKPVWEHCANKNSSTVVLVEDILSGIKVAESGINVIALLGTSLHNKVLVDVINKYDKVIIWLDSDKAGRDASLLIKSKLQNFVGVEIVNTEHDPKVYATVIIKGKLEDKL